MTEPTKPRKRLWEVTVTYTATGYAWATTETAARAAVDTSVLMDDAEEEYTDVELVTKQPGCSTEDQPVYYDDEDDADLIDDLTVGEAWAMQEEQRLDDEKRAAAEAQQEKLPL